MILFFKRIFPRRRRFLSLEKRERFLIVTLILTIGMIVASSVWEDARLSVVIFLSCITYPLAYWGLREDIKGVEKITLFILPVFFTLSVTLFYFLLPVRWLTRLPAAVLFSVGLYALLLCVNIYNVSANRSIQLLRAAQSVGFLITLIVFFLMTNIVLSFRLPFFINFILVFLTSSFLFFQFFWAILLENKLSWKIIVYSLGCGLIVGELALSMSFWPVRTTISALFLTSIFYTLGGTLQQHLLDRLFASNIREYIWIPIVVFLLMILVTQWG